MNAGVRALGVAESFRDQRSVLAGAVVRADRICDGFAFGTCTVGGTDATDAIVGLTERLDRPDVRYLFVAGIAPAWFNVVDLHRLEDRIERPVLSVSFEASDGLADAIREHFEADAARRRLATYHAQPDRRPVDVDDETVYVRAVGVDDDRAAELLRSFTPEGARPEPLRIARLAARAGDAARRRWTAGTEPTAPDANAGGDPDPAGDE